MRLRKLIRSANWKYAAGELLLIVAGVTLALMATSWYEGRHARQDEKQVLEQIAVALGADLAELRRRFETLGQSEQDLLALLASLRKDELGPEANGYFYSVARWSGGVLVRSGPYDVLKAQGFSLISNDSLRVKLVDLYEREIGGLASTTSVDQDFSLNQVLPYVRAVDAAIAASSFAREARNKYLAHRDRALALGIAQPLPGGSRKTVRDALDALAAALNAVSAHYLDSTTGFDIGGGPPGGALALLYVIDDGVRAERERRARREAGDIRPDDYTPRDI